MSFATSIVTPFMIPGFPALTINGMAWASCFFCDASARKRHISFMEARAALEADEDATFFTRVNRYGFVAREQVLHPGPGGGRIKLVRAFKRLERISVADFEQCWQTRHVPETQACFGPALLRQVANWPLFPETATRWGLDCDVVEELWFESIDTLRRSTATDARPPASPRASRYRHTTIGHRDVRTTVVPGPLVRACPYLGTMVSTMTRTSST